MFDVDGTLVESCEFDEACYKNAVYDVLGHAIDTNWAKYHHVSDAGILEQHIQEHDLQHRSAEIHAQVKSAFVAYIKAHLLQYPAQEVHGAGEFISFLRNRSDVSLSIATGGWEETAQLKLSSAGIDVSGILMASSNDHYSRTEIMKIALQKAAVPAGFKRTYFGDAAWDKKACDTLRFNFVLVGKGIRHSQAVKDFAELKLACEFIGL
jgi:hypothetical protein